MGSRISGGPSCVGSRVFPAFEAERTAEAGAAGSVAVATTIEREVPDVSRVLALIRDLVAEGPTRPAVVTTAETVTRAALWRRAAEMAERLAAQGVRRGDVVLVRLGRTAELAVAVLGSMLSGAAFCVADPGYPQARLQHMADVCRPRVTVATGLRLTAGPAEPVGRDDLAYVVFTSGSSGTPKAIEMPHRCLDNLVEWTLASTSPEPLRTLQFAPLGFDVFVQEVFTAWASGGALYLPGDADRSDIARVAELINDWMIQRLFLSPAALAALAELVVGGDRVPLSLREVAAAGEALRITPAVRQLFTMLPACRLHNHYGPAETHVATFHTLTRPAAEWPASPPIGRPVPGMTARIVDDELWLAGVGVAAGYRRDPVRTASRFVPVDWADAPAYRTGDLVREGDDGELIYLGRADDQVKIMGYRVEPGEVEAVLSQHPSVASCAVAAKESGGQRFLVGYVVGRTAGVQEFLAERLPAFMVPARLVPVAAIPLSSNGKIDRSRLPDPPPPTAHGDPPSSAAEQAVAAAFAEVTGRAVTGRDQSLPDLGGSSLSAALVLARLRGRYPVAVPLSDFLARPTVRELAALLADQVRRSHDRTLP
ncbi:non-ribosomal peptide synthetase [Amycolatopsis sp. NPDC003676]